MIYVSYRGVAQDAPVDIFRIKWYIEDAIRRSGVPHVMLRPTAFMDMWIDQILAKGIREKGVAMIFGDGNSVANYIAVEDVAEFAVKISRARGRERGGRSRRSVERVQNHLATLVERRLKSSASAATSRSRRCACSRPLVRPFNEVAARLMTLGLYSATESRRSRDGRRPPIGSASRRGRSRPTSNRWRETRQSGHPVPRFEAALEAPLTILLDRDHGRLVCPEAFPALGSSRVDDDNGQ